MTNRILGYIISALGILGLLLSVDAIKTALKITLPAFATNTIITLSQGTHLVGFNINGASGVGGIGVAFDGRTETIEAHVINCEFSACETAIKVTNRPRPLYVQNCDFAPTITTCIWGNVGGKVEVSSIRIFGAGSITTGIYSVGIDSVTSDPSNVEILAERLPVI